MKNALSLAIILAAGLAAPAQASKMAAPGTECGMKEKVTLGITFNKKAKSFGDAKALFEEQTRKIEDLAKQQKLAKFTLQSQNYNIYAQPDHSGATPEFSYQFNGNVSYILDNADAAFKFAELLTEQKYQVNLNSNSYRQGNCPQVAD